MKKIIALVTMLIIVFCLSGCENIVEETDEDVTAIVTDKYHRSGYYTKVGKVMYWHSTEYNVTLTYENYTTTFNNHELYDMLEIGEKLEFNLHRGYNEEGEEVLSYLELLDEEK